ncbi:MAG: hypothetical protein GF320_14135 [Armatimonadia bacterium]|nr:hypothetical protein [Armatimonadia bacterium]
MDADPSDEHYLSELMRVANDLAATQRQLAKTNARLTDEMAARELADIRRRAADHRAQHAERLERLSAMAAGVAHHLNNALTAVVFNASLALEHPDAKSDGLRALIDQVLQASQRAEEISSAMWTFTGHAFIHPSLEDLAKIAAAALRDVSQQRSARSDVGLDVRSAPLTVKADRSAVSQALDHLLRNAAEASPERGQVTVVVDRIALDDLPDGRVEVLPPAGGRAEHAALIVGDQGPGMELEVAHHAFDPFYSTKQQGRGLGLALVLGVMRCHGGAVYVASTSEAGTRVYLLFPFAEEE